MVRPSGFEPSASCSGELRVASNNSILFLGYRQLGSLLSLGKQPNMGHYLRQPEVILDSVWALPDRSLHTLGDAENSLASARTA